MKLLQIEYNTEIAPKPNESHIIQDERLPPLELTTSAFGLIFNRDQLLLPYLTDRGWDLPGGHIETSETPDITMCREVYEEVGAHLFDFELLGYQKVIIHTEQPYRYKYPYPISYQVFYWGRLSKLEPFAPTKEVMKRRFFPPDFARQLGWVRRFPLLYDIALSKSEAVSMSGIPIIETTLDSDAKDEK